MSDKNVTPKDSLPEGEDATEESRPQGGDDSDPSAELDAPGPGIIEDWDEDADEPAANTSGAENSAPESADTEEQSSTDEVDTPPPPFPFEEEGSPESDPGADEDEEEESPMTLMTHLEELRRRLKYVGIALILGCLACYAYAEQLFDFLRLPMLQVMPEASGFIYTAPHEAFLAYLKVAFLAGMFLTSPYVFYQIWAFVSPGLYEDERKWVIPVAIFSAGIFIGGAAFAYFLVFPLAFEFFMSFNTADLQAQIKVNEYLSFAVKLLLAFGIVFEMPLFALVLSRIGLVTAAGMKRVRPYAVICSFLLSAILTPPDVASQLLMAGPLLVLFELSILIAGIFGKKPAPQDEEDEAEAAEA